MTCNVTEQVGQSTEEAGCGGGKAPGGVPSPAEELREPAARWRKTARAAAAGSERGGAPRVLRGMAGRDAAPGGHRPHGDAAAALELLPESLPGAFYHRPITARGYIQNALPRKQVGFTAACVLTLKVPQTAGEQLSMLMEELAVSAGVACCGKCEACTGSAGAGR